MTNKTTEAKENYLLTISFAETVQGGEAGFSQVPKALKGILKRKPWENIHCEATGETVRFNNIREWIEAYPPEGLNAKVSTIEALIKDDKELLLEFQELAAPTIGDHGGNRKEWELEPTCDTDCDGQGADRTLTVTQKQKIVIKGSESNSYLVSRLHRDAPEYLGMIGEGKQYKTIREAAIAAGVLKQRVRIELKEDAAETAKDVITKKGVNYAMNLMAEIAQQLPKQNEI